MLERYQAEYDDITDKFVQKIVSDSDSDHESKVKLVSSIEFMLSILRHEMDASTFAHISSKVTCDYERSNPIIPKKEG